MGSDWKQLIGTVITGLIFYFLGAKLISIVARFKDHVRLPTSELTDPEPVRRGPGDSTELASKGGGDNLPREELLDGGDGDNDWEKVRSSSELDEELSGSANFGSGSGQAQTGQAESSSWVMI